MLSSNLGCLNVEGISRQIQEKVFLLTVRCQGYRESCDPFLEELQKQRSGAGKESMGIKTKHLVLEQY